MGSSLQPIRDLLEAGRGSAALVIGNEALSNLLAHAGGAQLLLHDATSAASPRSFARELASGLAPQAPPGIQWRLGRDLEILRHAGERVTSAELKILLGLLDGIATTRPLALLISDLDLAPIDTLTLIRDLAAAPARDPIGHPFVVLLQLEPERMTPVISAVLAELSGLPAFITSESRAHSGSEIREALGPGERAVLAAVAVVLVPASPRLLATIAGEREIDPVLRSLMARGLVHVDGSTGDERFKPSDLEAIAGVLGALSRDDRADLRLRAAVALADEGAIANAIAQLDALDAMTDGSVEAALLRAECLALSAPDRAAAVLDSLSHANLSVAQRVQTLALRAHLELSNGEFEVAARSIHSARRTLKTLSPLTAARAARLVLASEIALAEVALASNDTGPASRLLRRNDPVVSASGPGMLAYLAGERLMTRGSLRDALQAFTDAREQATAGGDLVTAAAAAIGVAATSFASGKEVDDREIDRSLARLAHAGRPRRESGALVRAAAVDAARGRISSATARFDDAAGIARQLGDRALVDRIAVARWRATGLLPETSEVKELEAHARRRGDLKTAAEAQLFLATIQFDQGRRTQAAKTATEAMKLARSLRHIPLIAEVEKLRARFDSDGPDAGIGHLMAALDALDGVGAKREAAVVVTTIRQHLSERSELTVPTAIRERIGLGSAGPTAPERTLALALEALRNPGEGVRRLARIQEAATASWAALVIDDRVVMAVGAAPSRTVVERTIARARSGELGEPWQTIELGDPPGRRVLLGSPAPSVDADLVNALAASLARAVRHAPTVEPGQSFGGLVGNSPAMQSLFTLLERSAGSDVPVLINGESGTGKELAARAIHDSSRRRDHAFVTIDCAALPEPLIESELFGHRRGAFTGTTGDHRGLLEDASGGTVFLDGVQNLGLGVQAKLLRVVAERKFRRVGDTNLIDLDVRVIAACDRPLAEAVRAGTFREDLYFRLNVIELQMPPLRERKTDIPTLVSHFLERGQPPVKLDDDASVRLCAYDWPGNVRELENELQRARAVVNGDVITVADLSSKLGATEHLATVPRLRPAIERLERELVARALEASGGHRANAARALGLSHQGLLNKIKKYRIRIAPKNKDQLS